MWWFGTPDSPLCDTDSLFQPHALWHVLTAVLALAWVDSAYAAADPDHPPRMFRRFTDRGLGMLAGGLVLGFHRSVDVAWRERLPTDRPVLVVANHGNGFVDPVVVAAVLGRLPRFLAKAALWKVVIARPFLASPECSRCIAARTATARATTHRSSTPATESWPGCDGRDLPRGDHGRPRRPRPGQVGGRTESRSVPLPTAPDVVIVPIGMAYESRVDTRSRVR